MRCKWEIEHLLSGLLECAFALPIFYSLRHSFSLPPCCSLPSFLDYDKFPPLSDHWAYDSSVWGALLSEHHMLDSVSSKSQPKCHLSSAQVWAPQIKEAPRHYFSLLLFLNTTFRADLGSQKNWGTQISHILPAPYTPSLPLSTSPTRVVHL